MTTLSYPVPVAGSTLNATADPEVASALSAILAWAAGGIDGSNIALAAAYLALKPQSVSGNTNAATGNLYRVTATATITLPTHSAGQVVGVMNSSGTTTVSGSNIQGVGLASASSYTLGAPGAFTLLVDDGTNWLIVAGQQDTGWQTLTVPSPFTAATGWYAPAVRMVGATVYLRGVVTNGGSSSPCSFGPLPNSAMWPTQPSGVTLVAANDSGPSVVWVFGVGNPTQPGRLEINTIPAGQKGYMDGLFYVV